jgi:hypothetical protein
MPSKTSKRIPYLHLSHIFTVTIIARDTKRALLGGKSSHMFATAEVQLPVVNAPHRYHFSSDNNLSLLCCLLSGSYVCA